MRPSNLVSFVALAVASVTNADIFQYADCDGDGSLLLTELDAVPGADFSGLYLGCAELVGADLSNAELSGANLAFATMFGAEMQDAFCKSDGCDFPVRKLRKCKSNQFQFEASKLKRCSHFGR